MHQYIFNEDYTDEISILYKRGTVINDTDDSFEEKENLLSLMRREGTVDHYIISTGQEKNILPSTHT